MIIIRKRIDYYREMRKTFFVIDPLPTDEPKQLKFGWTVIQQPDCNIIEQQISYCKRCNVQNEYMDFNPDWTCYSCRS